MDTQTDRQAQRDTSRHKTGTDRHIDTRQAETDTRHKNRQRRTHSNSRQRDAQTDRQADTNIARQDQTNR